MKLFDEPNEDSIAPSFARKSITDNPNDALTRRKNIIAVVNGCIRLTKNRKFSAEMVKKLQSTFELTYLEAETLLCESVLWVLSVADSNTDSNVPFCLSFFLVGFCLNYDLKFFENQNLVQK